MNKETIKYVKRIKCGSIIIHKKTSEMYYVLLCYSFDKFNMNNLSAHASFQVINLNIDFDFGEIYSIFIYYNNQSWIIL